MNKLIGLVMCEMGT